MNRFARIRHSRHSKLASNLALSLACAALAALLLPAAAQAQGSAAINGTVTDSTGAIVPAAEILLENVNTGIQRTAVTNERGQYSFTSLPSSVYTLQASKAGFQTAVIEPFTLRVDQTATFDITLDVGAVTETVTVQAVGAELQSSSAELGSVIAEDQVVDLPLNGRNFTQLLTLTPGASPVNTSQNSGGGFGSAIVGSFSFPSMNGQSNRSNIFLMDGVVNYESASNTFAVPPIVDSIQEFKVQTHNDKAEFGMARGGIVNVVTKSGTNEFHGSVFEFFRNDELDARNFFRANVTELRWNQYGGVVGGPIVRNKTFFFAGYQAFKLRQPADNLFTVPTEANLRGDLSDRPRQIFDPFSTREDPGTPGAFIRDPFPNNQIPQARLDQGFVEFARATLPSPIATGVADRNALDTSPDKLDRHELNIRLDHHLNQNNFLWARGSTEINRLDGSGGRQGLISFNDIDAQNIGAGWTHTTPTSVLEVRFGLSLVETKNGNSFENLPENFVTDVAGFSERFCCSFQSGARIMPAVNVSGFFGGGEQSNFQRPGDQQQFKADYSKLIGSHQIKFGGEFNNMDFFRLDNNHNVAFDSSGTASPQDAATGSPLASFLLNVPISASRRDFFKTTRFGGVMGLYFQDSWKASPKLTINLGFRYDRTFIPGNGKFEDRGIFAGAPDFNRGLWVLQATPGPCNVLDEAPCIPTPDGRLPARVIEDGRGGNKVFHDWKDNLQPRVGLAYRLTEKTALRGSFGLFFDSWSAVSQLAQNLGETWPDIGQRQTGNLNQPSSESPTPSVSAKDPFPLSAIPEPTPFNTVAWFADPKLENAYSAQWNFGIQHQVARDTIVQANYVGSSSNRLPLGGFFNTALTPGPGDPAERRPFPFMTPTFWDRSWGRSNYNALQLQARRQAKGLTYVVNYTWSKAINVGCDGFFGIEGCSIQDPYRFNNDRSVAGQDLTHNLNFNWVYELPIGPGKAFDPQNKVLSNIIGNWQINGIVFFTSGRPFTVNLNGDIANTGQRNGSFRPNLAGDPELASPTTGRYINTDAFVTPPQFTFGTAGRNILRADGSNNFDLSVFRRFPVGALREDAYLEFRAEFFNAFNSPQFAPPISNFSNRNFGQVVSTANTERQIQFALKLVF